MPKFVRKRFRFREATLNEAIHKSFDGSLAGTVLEWGDEGAVGLTIRITPGKPNWYLRRKEITIQLGDVRDLPLDEARYMSEQVRLAAKRGKDLREVVRVLQDFAVHPRRADHETIKVFEERTAAHIDHGVERRAAHYKIPLKPVSPFWTWRQLTEKFLDYKKPKLKEGYADEYQRYLKLLQFEVIADKMVRDIKLRDLERVRDDIAIAFAPSTVHRALTQSKAMLTWAWKYKATASGLEDCEYEWWARWSFEYETKERERTPTIEEIARTLVIAEKFTHLADGEHETYPGTLGALWGVCLTAQRTGAFLNLRADRLFDPPKTERKLKGWKIANWTANEMKGGRDGGRPHSLPMPPDALDILTKYHERSGGTSKWMFIGRNPNRHITQSALNLLLYRLQGRVYDHTVKQKPARKGKPGPKPRPKKDRIDLFELYGIEPWTLHDCRRTLTTHLDDRRLGGAATAILGHKTASGKTKEREKLARVTEQHYNKSQKIGLKGDGMTIWVKALLAAYRKELRAFRDLTETKMAA